MSFKSLVHRRLNRQATASIVMFAMAFCVSARSDEPVESQWVDGGLGSFLSHNANSPLSADRAKASLRPSWTPEAVRWRAKVAGYGQSTPVVHGATVYVTSVVGENKDEYFLEAFAQGTGDKRWGLTTENSHPVESTPMVSRAATTPVVDEDCIYVFYESGDVTAVSHEGKLLWHVDLQSKYGAFENEFGLSASPVQTSDSVIILVDHDGPSYLVAINKADGREKWRVDRGKRYRSWSSPGIVMVGDQPVIVCSSAGTIDGYDAASGNLLFSHAEVGGNTAATPIDLGSGQFLVSSLIRPSDGPSEHALESNLLAQIVRADSGYRLEVKWVAEDARGSFCSPIATRERCYFISPQGLLYCLDRQTGKEHFHERLPCGLCWATPIVDGDQLYLFGKAGQVMTIRDSDTFEVINADSRAWPEDDPTLAVPPGESKAPESIRQRMSGGTLYGAIVTESGLIIRRGDMLYLIDQSS